MAGRAALVVIRPKAFRGLSGGVEDYRASGSIAGMPLWLADTSKEKPHLRLIARRWLVLVTASMGLYLVLPELWVGPE